MTAHQPGTFSVCNTDLRVCVRFLRSQTAVFKVTHCARLRTDQWPHWWERGRGTVGIHKPLHHAATNQKWNLLERSSKVEMDQGEKEACPFSPLSTADTLSLATARSMVSSPTSRACREIYCAERIGSQLRRIARLRVGCPSKNLPPAVGAPCVSISTPETAPRRAGPCRRTPAGTHGQHLRFRTRTLGVGPPRGWGPLPSVPEPPLPLQPNAPFHAAVPSARTLSRSLSVSASMVSPTEVTSCEWDWLSQGCRENR